MIGNYGRLTRNQIRHQETQQRQEGRALFREETANTNVERCTHCLNDTCLPHSDSRSHLCHAHQVTLNDAMKNILGEHFELRSRKCTLEKVLDIRILNRRARKRATKKIIREVNRVVDWMRQVVIKTQGFVQYYVLEKFSEDNDILAGFFKPGCMYSVMQMVTR